MINTLNSQIKEIEKLRTLRQNIDPSAQEQQVNLMQMQELLKEHTRQTIKALKFDEGLL